MATRDVLVTGATGLIGRQITSGLVKLGHRVVAVDRNLDDRLQLIDAEIRDEVRWVEGDTRQFELISAAIASVDTVVHLAAGASFLMYEEAPLENTSGTIDGFHNVLEAAAKSGVSKVVYASTSAVYEGNDVPYHESMTLKPPDLKAFSKKVNEEMASLYSERYGINTLALRPFSVYGEDEMPKRKYANVVSLFIWAMLSGERPILWGDGSQTRDFIHVSDVARAFILAVECEAAPPALNVGTGVETSFFEVVTLISQRLGVVLEPRYVPVPIAIYAQRLWADTSLSERVLGFRPLVALEVGIARVIDRVRSGLSPEQRASLAVQQSVVSRDWG
jgi:UDP-glucose 4-epimerase